MKKSGFTLIEILIALFILAVGLVFLFNSFLTSWQTLAYSRRLNEISMLAQQKLEALKSENSPAEQETSGQENGLSWVLSVRSQAVQEGIQLKHAQLDVEFDWQGQKQKQSFVTYL